jgi:predicted enzyme related to lactoylglutathione lyase
LQKFYSEVFDWKLDTNNPGAQTWARVPNGPALGAARQVGQLDGVLEDG